MDNNSLVPSPISLKVEKETITPPKQQETPGPEIEDEEVSLSPAFDWKTIRLELACILFVGGLVPFGLFVWFSIRPLLH
jgi:hypothetical protein